MIKTSMKVLKYFSLRLLREEKLLALNSKVVKTPQIFEANNVFHSEGLFSNVIFGEQGSANRKRQGGRINLNISILHPLAFIGLASMKKLHSDILYNKKKVIFDNKINDFVEDENGFSGQGYYMKYHDKLKFENPNNSDLREFKIRLTTIHSKEEITSKFLYVIPAALRDYTIDKKGKPTQDDMNNYYRAILNLTSMIPEDVDENNVSEYVESIRTEIQKKIIELYNYLLVPVGGLKKSIIRGHMASKVIDYGTRNVLTADTGHITQLGVGDHLRYMDTAVGLFQYAKAMEPIARHKLSVVFNQVFSKDNKTGNVIDLKNRKSEIKEFDNRTIEGYTTKKGISSYLNKFSSSDFSKSIFGVDEYAYALIKEVNNTVELILDTGSLTDEDWNNCRPITNLELLYIVLLSEYDKYYATTTRYPAIEQGSQYPTKPNVRPTNNSKFKTIIYEGIEYKKGNYPDMTSDNYDSMTVHFTKLERMTADHDGDTTNFGLFLTEEANEEIRKILNGRAFYIDANNVLAYSVGNDIMKYTEKSIHRLTHKG